MGDQIEGGAKGLPPSDETKRRMISPRLAKFLTAVLSLIALVLLLATLEVAARIHQYVKMGNFATYKPRHLVDFYRLYKVNPAYRSRTVRVDAEGFRNEYDVTREKPSGLVRIVMMGGSTVWGEDSGPPIPVMIDNQDTIAAHLEHILNERALARRIDLRVEVLNAGVVGYRIFQEVNYFNQYVAQFNPDLVIAMDGHNDLDALQLGVDFYHHRAEPSLDREVNAPTLMDLCRWAVKYAEDRSMFVRKAVGRLQQEANRRGLAREQPLVFSRHLTEAEIEEFLQQYEATVRRFDASVRIANAWALFTVQPELAGERYKSLTSEELRLHNHWAYYSELHTTVRDRLIQRMTEAAHRYGVWFEDVSEVFKDETANAYIDYAHLSNRGAEVMATRLADLTESVVFKSRRKALPASHGGVADRRVRKGNERNG